MPCIELRGVSNFACRDIDLKVENQELMVLLGPTGAGKTTLLNIVAGLIEYEGSVLFDGVSIDSTSCYLRGVGYLFQDLALFPHLSVSANIAFGLKACKTPPFETTARVKEMMQLVRIENLAHRYPRDLSGGEQQRVALARALAPAPRILLLDEPLSSLDFSTSKYLRMELKRLHREFGVTTIYVTHNQREAKEMGDRITVIHDGVLEQTGSPEDIFFNPQNQRISEFIGSPNILECEHSRDLGMGLVEIKTRGLSIVVPDDGQKIKKIAISPQDIYISANPPPGPDINRFNATIVEMFPSSSLTKIRLKVGDHSLLAEQPAEAVEELGLQSGDEIYIILKLRWIKVLSGLDN